ncbi:MAG: hypothetical protein D8M57_01290 [Candidatus Scalindua sp. AMX11]|nr:MAG: hypothetical protein DWQ00_15270 [Candidatus Scalindua sp.]TDE66701.1 MAG: hypothetical protein D8M57_01290 [Candidatus Scalindua sp. AMX11]
MNINITVLSVAVFPKIYIPLLYTHINKFSQSSICRNALIFITSPISMKWFISLMKSVDFELFDADYRARQLGDCSGGTQEQSLLLSLNPIYDISLCPLS